MEHQRLSPGEQFSGFPSAMDGLGRELLGTGSIPLPTMHGGKLYLGYEDEQI
jgi:hypothetical protein